MGSQLNGLRLWVTRPRNQAGRLIATLREKGADVAALPLLEIAPPSDFAPLDSALAQLDLFDWAIFVSPSAMDATLDRLSCPWPIGLPVIVMGPGSERRAQAHGIHRILSPNGSFDSAGLLGLPEMQHLAGKRIVLFRGDGGREDLPQTLIQRGVALTLIQTYRRLPPTFDEPRLCAELDCGCDGIVISSSEAVRYLFRLAGESTRQRLQSRLYFAPHSRIIEALAHEGAFNTVFTNVGDAGITESVIRYFAQQRLGTHHEDNA